MKTKRPTRRAGFLALGVLALAGAQWASALSAKLGPKSTLGFEGDSTMHAFECVATATEFKLSSDNADFAGLLASPGAAQLTLSVPAKSLKSKHSGLEKNMLKALKADQFPNITFALSGYKVAKATVTATGDLSIAGVKKTVDVEGTAKIEAGRLIVDGRKELLMSEYGIKPPTMMMGAVKVADRVVVTYHLDLETDSTGTTKEAK